jgi:hypothetical protein
MDLVVEKSAQSTIRPKATMKALIPKKTSLEVKVALRTSFLKERIVQTGVQINLRIKNSQTKINRIKVAKEAGNRSGSFNFLIFFLFV